jgi:hypothetical protein
MIWLWLLGYVVWLVAGYTVAYSLFRESFECDNDDVTIPITIGIWLPPLGLIFITAYLIVKTILWFHNKMQAWGDFSSGALHKGYSHFKERKKMRMGRTNGSPRWSLLRASHKPNGNEELLRAHEEGR